MGRSGAAWLYLDITGSGSVWVRTADLDLLDMHLDALDYTALPDLATPTPLPPATPAPTEVPVPVVQDTPLFIPAEPTVVPICATARGGGQDVTRCAPTRDEAIWLANEALDALLLESGYRRPEIITE